MGWIGALICIVIIIGGYIYFRQPELLWRHLSGPQPLPQLEGQLPSEDLTRKSGDRVEELKPAAKNDRQTKQPAPTASSPQTAARSTQKPQASKTESLTQAAAADLEKIMAASGETAAANNDINKARVMRVNELVVFYDTQTRVLRAKVELLKNLVSQAPAVIAGQIFIVLKTVGDENEVITLPRIPFSTGKLSDFAERGMAFSLEDQKTTYIKTQLSKQPARQQHLTIYIFDKKQTLLLRETRIIKIKLN